MKARRYALAALSFVAVSCAQPDLVGPSRNPTNADVFDALWTEFDLHYSFFEIKRVNWDSMRTVYRPRAVEATSDAALANVLGKMLAGLRDRHVSLTPTGSVRSIAYLSRTDSAAAPFDAGLVERRYLQRASRTTGGRISYGFVSPTVGYLRIPTFEGQGWSSELDAALTELRGVQSMIVDVRGNPGGTQRMAVEAAGRFTTSSTLYAYARFRNGPKHSDFTDMVPQHVTPAGPAQFRGRVIVLTNRKVYSSGEDFVLAMRALPTVTTMGDSTAGASGRPMTRELPNGWTFQLSTWIAYTPDRQVFENIGLAPDVYAATRGSDLLKGVDPVLERAMEALGVNK